jgi:sugar transferase (PEP-CTERM/EpsH1 system associated)
MSTNRLSFHLTSAIAAPASTRRIRIMHVVSSLTKGGLENGLANLVERMDRGRFEHVVCAVRGLGANAERLAQSATRVLDLGEASGTLVQTPALVRAIRQYRPDIVHSRNWGASEAVLAGRLRGCSVIHSEHGFTTEERAEPRRRSYFRRLIFELAHRVLTVSRQLRDVHAKRTGFSAQRIGVIHNGVDRTRFFPDGDARRRVRADLAIPDAALCIGSVANLLPVKDHVTLLRAVDAAADRLGPWRLVLVGDGPERPALEAFVHAHAGWQDRVLFQGSSDRVPDLLRAMDVFVLPSISEGMCNALLEAMATGLAVVATNVGGNPEIIDAQSGLLFRCGDVRELATLFLRLQGDPELRAQLGARAIAHIREEFSLESMVGAYERLYAGVGARAAQVEYR